MLLIVMYQCARYISSPDSDLAEELTLSAVQPHLPTQSMDVNSGSLDYILTNFCAIFHRAVVWLTPHIIR